MNLLIFLASFFLSPFSWGKSLDLKHCSDITQEDRKTIGFKCSNLHSSPYKNEVWTRVEHGGFKEAWEASASFGEYKLIWSEPLGVADNKPIGPESPGPITNSSAAQMCKEAGGRLPSAFEYDYFHDTIRSFLSNRFPNMPNDPHNVVTFFWTSTRVDLKGEVAWVYRGSRGYINTHMARDNTKAIYAVRCVAN